MKARDASRSWEPECRLALTSLRSRLEAEELAPDDLVFTVDADGQHDLAVLDELVELTIDDHVDAMLARFRERADAVKRRPLPPVAGATGGTP